MNEHEQIAQEIFFSHLKIKLLDRLDYHIKQPDTHTPTCKGDRKFISRVLLRHCIQLILFYLV